MTWEGGSTRAWRKMRAAVLQRDRGRGCRAHREGWCARAIRKTKHQCTDQPEHAHHTLGRALTGDDPNHIVAACEACNLYIGDPISTVDPPAVPVTRW
jgi:5-methylcytosine-specific restriction endonuclease McrA